MLSLILRVICGVCIIIFVHQAVAIPRETTRIDSDAIIFPDTNDDDSILNHLPFLHGINLNTKDKVQATKTPIQRSSAAFALDLTRVSCKSINLFSTFISMWN